MSARRLTYTSRFPNTTDLKYNEDGMNIICNNCVGARLYEVMKQQFPNPFMWNAIQWKEFIRLVNEFDDIRLENMTFELEKYPKNELESVVANLENGLKVHYIHYIQDSRKSTPVRENGVNILYRDILGYAEEKFRNRLNRSKEYPTFLFSFNYMDVNSQKYTRVLNELLKVRKRMTILVHSSTDIAGECPDNIRILRCDDNIMELNGRKLAIGLKDIVFDSKQ